MGPSFARGQVSMSLARKGAGITPPLGRVYCVQLETGRLLRCIFPEIRELIRINYERKMKVFPQLQTVEL